MTQESDDEFEPVRIVDIAIEMNRSENQTRSHSSSSPGSAERRKWIWLEEFAVIALFGVPLLGAIVVMIAGTSDHDTTRCMLLTFLLALYLGSSSPGSVPTDNESHATSSSQSSSRFQGNSVASGASSSHHSEDDHCHVQTKSFSFFGWPSYRPRKRKLGQDACLLAQTILSRRSQSQTDNYVANLDPPGQAPNRRLDGPLETLNEDEEEGQSQGGSDPPGWRAE